MNAYYFTFRSMTKAQEAAMELSKLGISATFSRSPKAVSDLGCGYAVRVDLSGGWSVARALRNLGIRFEKVVQISNGTAREVWL